MRRIVLTLGVAAIVLALWWLGRPAPLPPLPAQAPSATAPATSPGAALVTPAGAAGGRGAAGAAGPAEAVPESPATAASAAAPVVGDVDARQDAKIARGLASNPSGGLRVEGTPPGSVTGLLHLQVGDVLTQVNGEGVDSPEDFVRIYRAQGTPSTLTLLRDGREIHLHQ